MGERGVSMRDFFCSTSEITVEHRLSKGPGEVKRRSLRFFATAILF